MFRALFLGGSIYYSKKISDHINNKSEFISIVPAQINELLKESNFQHISHLFIGGSKISQKQLELITKSNIPTFISYGMTEQATTICARKVTIENLDPRNVGRPLSGKLLKTDSTGTILIKSNSHLITI